MHSGSYWSDLETLRATALTPETNIRDEKNMTITGRAPMERSPAPLCGIRSLNHGVEYMLSDLPRRRAYADITMFGDVALVLLKMMGHSGTVPSSILAADVPAALSRLKAARSHAREVPATFPSQRVPALCRVRCTPAHKGRIVPLQRRRNLQPESDSNPPVGFRQGSSPRCYAKEASKRRLCVRHSGCGTIATTATRDFHVGFIKTQQ